MGYDFSITGYYKIKFKKKTYPWPCKSKLNRTILIFDSDILTLMSRGIYMKHTGLGCLNIEIPKKDLIYCKDKIDLRLL